MLSPSTATRIADQLFARRCHESLATWRKAATALSEGPEEREPEPRCCRPCDRNIRGATSSGNTVRGVAEKAWPSDARRWFQQLVHKGSRLDLRAVGHLGRGTAKATSLMYLGGGGALQRQLDGLDQGSPARNSSAIGPKR